jgi:plasmid stability protein
MTLTIEIVDDLKTILKHRAQAQGVSAEQYARRVLDHGLKSDGGPRSHISEVIRENMRDVPPEVLAQLPTDGASEHDHYIYGLPKGTIEGRFCRHLLLGSGLL